MQKIDRKFIHELCEQYGIRPSKFLGQNFLISEKVLNRIIEKAELKKTDIILEVGSGLGVLTQKIFPNVSRVVAVEKDRKMVEILDDRFESIKNLEIIEGDILKFDPAEVGLKKYKIIANLPYNISSKFLEKFLAMENAPSEMILMFQKEVGEKLCAKPGDMSVLSVATQFYSDPEVLFQVANTKFFPIPKVSSAIVRLRLKKEKTEINTKEFFKIVRAGFLNKRKKLRNNLKSLYSEIDSILEKSKLNMDVRAEALSMDDWVRLYETIKKQN